MKNFKQGLFTPAALTLAMAAASAHAGEHEHRAHGAHEHGAANIDLIFAGTEIAVQWRTPAANLLGFEHKPKTSEQHKAVKHASATLADFTNIIALPASADCKLLKYDVAGLAFEDSHDDHDHDKHDDKHDDHHDGHDKHDDKHDDHHDDKHDDHGHDKHDDKHDDHHDDKHDDHGHDKHDDKHDDHHDDHGHDKHDDKHDDHHDDHGHDDHDHDESSHSDVVINYQLQCSKPAEIKSINFTLFEHFKGTEKVALQGIVNDQQLMQTLTPSNAKLAW